MSEEARKFENSDQEQLVAYLDGELDAELARSVEDRLSADEKFRKQLQSLERSWELLDELPRSDVGEDFTQTTIGMVAQQASDDLRSSIDKLRKSNVGKWIGILVSTAATAAVGFWGFSYWLDRDNRELMNDLAIIERVDMYSNIDDLEFLLSLSDESLFGEEADEDEL